MKLAYLRWVGPAIVSIMLAGPAFGAASLPTQPRPVAAAPSSPAAPAAPAPAAAPASASDIAGYAERERQAQALERFRGGAGIYIGGSVLVLVLVILLIVLLI